MRYNDNNIPVECPECPAMMEGFADVLSHILEAHSDQYTQAEAADYAQRWIEAAYEPRREEAQAYYADRQIDRAIEADAFPHK